MINKTLAKGLPQYIRGLPLMNANGDIDVTSPGFQFAIDTLSYIKSKIIDQKFYEIPIADFIPVDVGEAAWSSEIVQNTQFFTGGSFFEGDVDTSQGNSHISGVDAALSPIKMPVKTWAKQTAWTIFEIAMAAQSDNWDAVSGKLKSLKKNWELGIQEVAFLGHPAITTITGLLNDSAVNSNTTLITVAMNNMTAAQFNSFVAGALGAYFTNGNSTVLPDTLIIPTDAYLGLVEPFSSTYPNISRIEYLTNAFKRATGNEDFKVLPLAYAMAANNSSRGINKNRYVLYRRDPDSLYMSIPVDFTMLEADTGNKINWAQPAYGQYSGTLIARKREVLYIDQTST